MTRAGMNLAEVIKMNQAKFRPMEPLGAFAFKSGLIASIKAERRKVARQDQDHQVGQIDEDFTGRIDPNRAGRG